MKILITNDDGIEAKGLAILENIARQLSDDVWVVAPAQDMSGASRSLSLANEMQLKECGENRWSLGGTPVDCVIMGIKHLAKGADLVLSGINEGQNMADYIHYSGTVAAAMEGALLGIKSVALSQARNFKNESEPTNWNVAKTFGKGILKKFTKVDFPKNSLLNINFPNCDAGEVSGSEITRQAFVGHALGVEKNSVEKNSVEGVGKNYKLTFASPDAECAVDSDIEILNQKKISITPLGLNLTCEKFLEQLHGTK